MRALALPSDGWRHARQTWWIGYLVVVGGGLLITALARRRVTEPFLGLSLAVMLLLLLGWLIQPRATLYAVLFFTSVSDTVTVWWFPFAKNLSSRESISFVADALTISPLEIALYIGAAVSCVRRYADSGRFILQTPLNKAIMVFTAFVALGFARGIVMMNGDVRIAVLEGRALFYILLTFVIVINECTDRAHLRYSLWAVLAGVFVQSVLSIEYLSRLEPAETETLESLNEHGSSIGHNLVIVALLGFVLLRIKRPLVRLALVVALVPTVYVFFVAQRRAGVAALVVAGALMAVVLFWRRRRTFWVVTPIVTIVLTGYVGAFWNSTAAVGFPAQAIKTIVAPDSASEADRNSDLYRLIEAYDLNFTIRAEPVLGLGFGRAFYRPLPLPDISVFALNPYVPHNNVLWVWIKLGFGGFAAMFYLFAKSITLGADRLHREALDADFVVTLSATLFLVMYLVYSWVDVSWDARNTVFLGLALAICAGRIGGGTEDESNDVVTDELASSGHSLRPLDAD